MVVTRLEDSILLNLKLSKENCDLRVYNIVDLETKKVFGQIHTGVYNVGGVVDLHGEVIAAKLFNKSGNFVDLAYGRKDVFVISDVNYFFRKLGLEPSNSILKEVKDDN